MATVLIPLPDGDFDPTEAGVSWQVLVRSGHRVQFATPSGHPARGDDLMLTGRGLDPWGFLPGLSHLVGVGRVLRADDRARSAYAEMVRSVEFLHPCSWEAMDLDSVDGLLLAGGHRAPGMRTYLESPVLFEAVVGAFRRDMPVAAICHGVLAGGPQHRSGDRSVGAARPTDHRADLVPRAAGLAAGTDDPLLGPRLLPHLPRAARSTGRLHVRATGGHPSVGPARRLRRRRPRRSRWCAQAERPSP